MKKITDFLVENRYVVLIVFIFLAILSFIVSDKVVINHDIAKYLPSSSETRQGLDIMEEEFKEETSTLSIMLENLTEEEEAEAYQYLLGLEGVEDVAYEKSDDYHQDNDTLYILTISGDADSKAAKNVYAQVQKHFKDSLAGTSGDVSSHNKVVLPFYIIVLAVASAFIILVIMSESYIEPVLFLITILIAVALNKGTNIIFPQVSNITNGIASILQMALSMDYSIMLMNRYRQEREKSKDKVSAMKKALYHAFTAISSSSVTTIVGLLALVFMSFKIGKDLGFVLAKGVLLSLISIFTCLPGFIIMCDSLMQKTKKKSPIIELKKVGKISYHARYVGLVLFVVVFIGSYLLKGNLGILYTTNEDNPVIQKFPETNQMAIIYPNQYEEEMAKVCLSLENHSDIKGALCYGNTINEPLTYQKLNPQFHDLGSDVEVDEYLLKILYYHYQHPKEEHEASLLELVNFLENTVYGNEKMNQDIDKEMKYNITRLRYFVEKKEVQKGRTAKEISQVLNIQEDTLEDLLLYYDSKNISLSLSLSEFLSFMEQEVLSSPKWSEKIDASTVSNLAKIKPFMDEESLSKKYDAKSLASLFSMNASDVEKLYLYYRSVGEISTKLSIQEFTNFVLQEILTNEEYQKMFDENSQKQILLLNIFSDKEKIQKDYTSSELATLLGMDNDTMRNLFVAIFGSQDNGTKMTMGEFVNYVNLLKNTPYLQGKDLSIILPLAQNEEVMKNPTLYSATELANILGVDSKDIYFLYAMIDSLNGKTDNWKLSPYQFVSTILNQELFVNSKDSDTLTQLRTLQFIMQSTLANQKYSYLEFSQLFAIDEQSMKLLYSVYLLPDTKLTPYEFVTFLCSHKQDETLQKSLTTSQIEELTFLKEIMNSVLTKKSYKALELARFLGVDESSMRLLYALYHREMNNFTPTVSFQEFVSFLLDDVLKQEEYQENFDIETRQKLKTLKKLMQEALENKQYTHDEAYEILLPLASDLDKNLIDLVYIYHGSETEYDENFTMTVEQFITYINEEILTDERFDSYIDSTMHQNVVDAKETIEEAKKQLIGKNYSRVVLETTLEAESEKTFSFIQNLEDSVQEKIPDTYIVGDSPMAYEMSQTFQGELNFITILTMLFIFMVVVVTFRTFLIPVILVLLIQSAVFLTMGLLSFSGSVYFISILIVQSILMGATIDYAILYTSYYLEFRKEGSIQEAIIQAYNRSIHTILTSASILVIVTLIVGVFSSAITSQICKTISQGSFCSSLLIITLLPAVLAACDKYIVKR